MLRTAHVAFSRKFGVVFVGVLIVRALLFGVWSTLGSIMFANSRVLRPNIRAPLLNWEYVAMIFVTIQALTIDACICSGCSKRVVRSHMRASGFLHGLQKCACRAYHLNHWVDWRLQTLRLLGPSWGLLQPLRVGRLPLRVGSDHLYARGYEYFGLKH